MFGAFVAYRVRVAWSHLARGHYACALDQLARDLTHSSPATTRSAASGTQPRSAARVFERLFRLLPGPESIVDDVESRIRRTGKAITVSEAALGVRDSPPVAGHARNRTPRGTRDD
jgi:hypothetical protein